MDVEQALQLADGVEGSDNCYIVALQTLAAEVRRLQGAVPAGHVRDEKGVDYRIGAIGTDVPVTADGEIVMHGDLVYHPDDPLRELRVRDTGDVDDDWGVVVKKLREGGESISDDEEVPQWAACYWYFEPDTGYREEWIVRVSSCYATRAAAEAARERGQA